MDPLQLAIARAKFARWTPINRPRPPEQKPKIELVSTSPDPALLPGVAPWRRVVDTARIPPAPFTRAITFRRIVALVAEEFNVTPEQIRGHYRTQKFVFPRHLSQYLAQRVLCLSLPLIGRYFFRDHSSVLHAIRKLKRKIDEDPTLRETVERLEAQLRA